MSDSLRDQMMQAGFKETAPAKRKQNKRKQGGKFVAKPHRVPHKQSDADSTSANTSINKSVDTSANRSTNTSVPASAKTQVSGPTDTSAKSTPRTSSNTPDTEVIAKRKAIKAQIKQLIETRSIAHFSGDSTHAYTMGSRIKQLYVRELIRLRIVSGEYVITRLNGTTQLIPAAIADQIHALNPDWIVVKPAQSSDSEDETYAEFKVPDNLTW